MNFGIVAFNQVEEMDFIGPWEMLNMWRTLSVGPENCLIVSESMQPVLCAKGLSVNPHVTFETCPLLDYLLIPGGQGTRSEVNNPALIRFVQTQAPNCKVILSVCTGSFVLHAAGLLSGKKATTHWASLARLRELGDVDVIEERFVKDGNIWTSAGISAGVDMMLAFIAHEAGEKCAGLIQARTEYYPSDVRYGDFDRQEQAPAYIRK